MSVFEYCSTCKKANFHLMTDYGQCENVRSDFYGILVKPDHTCPVHESYYKKENLQAEKLRRKQK